MSKKIVITGATGLIGRKLSNEFIKEGNQVTVVSRSIDKARKIIPDAYNYIEWDYKKEPADFVNGNDIIIHLMGENIMAKRWSDDHKKNVFESRVDSTYALVKAISNAEDKPSAFIHSSAIGFYGIGNFEADENTIKGNGFLADVVDAWEKEAEKVEKENVRRVSVRLGIVLDKNDGALKRMILPFRLFIGGPLGSGKQWFPWISIDDVVRIFKFIIENEKISGPVNAVSPGVVSMKEFASSLGNVLKRPALIRVPEFILKLILGEAAEALIYGVKVKSKKLGENRFEYNDVSISEALKKIMD